MSEVSGGSSATSPVKGWRRRTAVSASRCRRRRPSGESRMQWSLSSGIPAPTKAPVSRLKKRTRPRSLGWPGCSPWPSGSIIHRRGWKRRSEMPRPRGSSVQARQWRHAARNRK
uniref:Uncharacterized protein n=1 Tax=Arundo donax TaxID=35708 RepID=A0A0A9GR71_ARUDO